MNQVPIINGQAYDWASIDFHLLGAKVYGVTAIEYSEKQEKVNNYASGTEPSSRGRGKVEYTGKITLEEKEVRRVLAALPKGKNLRHIPPFTITVSYLVGTQPVTDKVLMCEFTGQSVKAKTGDTSMENELELVVGGIQWGR
jgi:hypothetical protein